MNLQQLYYFRKLAEVQHYTEAAKALYITQPSLSDSKASFRLRYSKKKAATSSSPNMEKNFPSMSISLWKFWNTASPS